MKTWKNLYPSICSFENLLLAARKAQRGRRFWPEVYAFNSRLEENLVRMQRELESQTWEPGPYRDFYVQEAKRRLISAAPYADRVVHHQENFKVVRRPKPAPPPSTDAGRKTRSAPDKMPGGSNP